MSMLLWLVLLALFGSASIALVVWFKLIQRG